MSPRRCQHQSVWFVCGSFYKSSVGGSVSLGPALQVLLRHLGNELACLMSAEGQKQQQSLTLSLQGDYGVQLTQTNC